MTITSKVVRRARRRYGVKILWHADYGSKARAVYAWRRKHRPVTRLKTDTIVQHITVTRPSGNFKEDVRTVERIGMERFGSGISYNFVVDMATGQVAVGQPLDAKGTHTLNDKGVAGYSHNQNLVARAIAVVGMPGTPLSDKAERAIAGLLAAMEDVGASTGSPDYKPHSFFAWKDCPCDPTRNRMDEIYRRAQRRQRRAAGGGDHVEEERERISLKRVQRAARRAKWTRGFGPKIRHAVGVVEGALEDEGLRRYRDWQIEFGIPKEKADGLPRRADLEALGKRNGFRVVE